MKIVKIKHDESNIIVSYGLDNGTVVGKYEAIKMIESGKIKGAYLGFDENGNKTIVATSGTNRKDDIKNLPEVY